MDIYHYRFGLSDLKIDKGDIERLMGYGPGESPDPFPGIIDEVYHELGDHTDPQGGYVIIEDPLFDLQLNRIRIGTTFFRTDKTVTRMLRKSERLALFVCTAGEGIEGWTKRTNVSGDPVKGFVIDAFGSEIAEAVAAALHLIVKEHAAGSGQKTTNRYSPGYCGWPVGDQQELFTFFPERFCGITLSESSLMHPIKSVSGMIGIGPHVRYRMYTCDTCTDKDCIYRRLRTG